MATIYGEAEEVGKIAESLIAQYHPELSTARFRFLYRDKASKKGGKEVMGTVKKMGELMDYLIDVDFLMEIPLEIWNTLDNTKRTALVDHLLERCTGEEDEKTGTMKWAVRTPDVHEFNAILRRYGAWNDDLTQFASVAQTIDLGFMEAEDTDVVEEGSSDIESVLSSLA